MLIESERLALRPWTLADYDLQAGLLQDAATMHHWPAPLDDAAVHTWLARNVSHYHDHGFSRFCVMHKEDGDGAGGVVGDVGVVWLDVRGRRVADLGYIIHADYWQRGFGFEAAAAVLNWMRPQQEQLGVKTIVATMATDNVGSAAVARKLGMTLVETFRNPNNLDKETFYFEMSLGER